MASPAGGLAPAAAAEDYSDQLEDGAMGSDVESRQPLNGQSRRSELQRPSSRALLAFATLSTAGISAVFVLIGRRSSAGGDELAAPEAGAASPAASSTIATFNLEQSLGLSLKAWENVEVAGYLPPWLSPAADSRAVRTMLSTELTEEGDNRSREIARYSLPQYWDAPVDHFSPSWESSSTFKQKYYVNDEFHRLGGPVFFELGGEGPVGGSPGGFVKQLAKTRGALLVQVEHRFYGESIPNGNVNSSNLKFLTVDQALADYAGFIDWYSQKAMLPLLTKWFVFGGSYPGALASWFRISYPDKTVGSLSSSGVVNSIFDFVLFDVHIERAIGPKCAEAHRAVTAAFEASVLRRGSQEEHAKALLNAPKGMSDGDFFYMLADALAMMVQYGRKSLLCSNLTMAMNATTDDALMSNAAALVKNFWGSDFGSQCFYDTNCLKDPLQYKVGATDRSWRWQKCYELAYLQSAPKEGQSFDGEPLPSSLRSSLVNMTYMVNQCFEVFGEAYAGLPDSVEFATRRINAKFGGPNPTATKVFYSNFADDPWMEASVMPPRDVDPSQPYQAAYCDDCGHCMDLRTPRYDDPAELVAVRSRFEKYLDQWLA